MNDALRWLLDLDSLAPGGANVALEFQRALPAWGWASVVLWSGAFAAWSYWRLEGARPARIALASLRTLLLITLVVLACGPRLVDRTETVERDWVVALVDRSASLTVEDAPADTGRRSRDAQLRAALEASGQTWSGVAEDREVVWLGFDAGVFDLPRAPESGAPALEAPEGAATSLRSALDEALRRAAARPLSAVVLFSDGRSLDDPSRAAVRRLQAERVPVHVVPLGSERPVGDVALRRVESPRIAFVNDVAPVSVEIDRVGQTGGGVVRLVEKSTGRTLAEQRIEPGEGETAVTLTHNAIDAGRSTWVVEVIPEGADLIAGNNSAEVMIELVDRPMRVLYIDGYPRWEQRYLKNLLIREQSIVSSNLLLAPDRRFIQEGDVELDALPDSPERWADYDVVVLGDVQPDVFTRSQLEQLRDHVATRGGGLIWIAGPSATPSRWWDTPLADLLPIVSSAGSPGPIGVPVVMRPTQLAERTGALRLSDDAESGWPADLADPSVGWSQLRWAQRIDPSDLKPAAEPLAYADAPSARDAEWPLVVSMRYGAGRSLYVATDEIWRWRYGRGELLPERFWLQLVRMLGRESLARSQRDAALEVAPRRATVEQPVRISVELLDQSLIDAGFGSIALRIAREDAQGDSETELVLRPEEGAGRASQRFSAIWTPGESGVFVARVVEPGLTAMGLEERIVVSRPDDELRRPEADHALLARLSEETGGRVFEIDQLDELPRELPNRRVTLVQERFETLWDTPLALIIVISLAATEWIGRKVLRLA